MPSINRRLLTACCTAPNRVADTLFAPSVPYAPDDLPPRRFNPDKARTLLEKRRLDANARQGIFVKKTGARCDLNWLLSAPMRWLSRWRKSSEPICAGRYRCRAGRRRGEQYLCPPARWPLHDDLQPYPGRAVRPARVYELNARRFARRLSGAARTAG